MRNGIYAQVDQLNQQVGDMYDRNDDPYDNVRGLTEKNERLRDELRKHRKRADSLDSDLGDVEGNRRAPALLSDGPLVTVRREAAGNPTR